MSIALLSGAIIAYPMNWWLVAHHLKHGMITVRRPDLAKAIPAGAEQKMAPDVYPAKPSAATILKMAILSIAIFGVGIAVSFFSNRH
jgi:hypothetical protein